MKHYSNYRSSWLIPVLAALFIFQCLLVSCSKDPGTSANDGSNAVGTPGSSTSDGTTDKSGSGYNCHSGGAGYAQPV